MRFSDEVMWADEDHQLGILNTLSSAGANALARALDFGVIHAINPLSGSKISTWTITSPPLLKPWSTRPLAALTPTTISVPPLACLSTKLSRSP